MTQMAKRSQVKNRRSFLRTLAAAPMLPAVAAASPQDAAPPQRPTAEVDAIAETVRIRFGQYLADDDMPEIKRGIERMLRNAEALAKIKITNGDEPDFMFHPRDSV
jgi:hypothetical protein